jgi:hypothetical protein
MKKLLGSALVAVALLATSASAKDGRSFGQIYEECGLGGIIGDAAGGGQAGGILAIVTNVTWDLGTTAVSSEVTSPNSCSNKGALTATIINEGYNKLEEEIALGDGAYLQALQKVNEGSLDTVALRDQLSTLANSEEYATLSRMEKSEKLYNIVNR